MSEINEINWDQGMPAAPPTAEYAHLPLSAEPVGAPLYSAPERQASAVLTSGRVKKGLAGFAGLAVFASGSVVAANIMTGGESESASSLPDVALAQNSDFEACDGEAFTNGAYEASLNVQTPGDLHREPAETLKDTPSLNEYLFGGEGVACNSAITLAVIKTSVLSLNGQGAAEARGFDVFASVDEQAQHYVDNPADALEDADKLSAYIRVAAALNTEEVKGTYLKVVGVQDGEIVRAEVAPTDVNFAKETVFIIRNVGDNGDITNQIFVFDKETGQIYLLENIGLNEQQPEPEAQDQEGNTGGGSGDTEGEGGGDEEEQHNGLEKGCNGSCGSGSNKSGNGTGQGAGGQGGGPGGQCGGGCGTTGTTPSGGPEESTPPQTTPNTAPPSTEKPPTTKPPVTTPPVTTPPPTTPPTTKPKGEEPVDPDAPN
ncbi:MAG: hypothetical protein QG553_408 [Patescibacteria group bacterium]|nr:hypothetical protein [Patescibacteria group bacterium]